MGINDFYTFLISFSLSLYIVIVYRGKIYKLSVNIKKEIDILEYKLISSKPLVPLFIIWCLWTSAICLFPFLGLAHVFKFYSIFFLSVKQLLFSHLKSLFLKSILFFAALNFIKHFASFLFWKTSICFISFFGWTFLSWWSWFCIWVLSLKCFLYNLRRDIAHIWS